MSFLKNDKISIIYYLNRTGREIFLFYTLSVSYVDYRNKKGGHKCLILMIPL
nr:MAG TPA: hypothetical protein [Caudoviricetes sp.]